jgi:L-threonylcarbamoyladenylate synthase
MKTTLRLGSDPASIHRAAEILRAGGLVAFPTETVYGLGADASNGRAVAAIYAAKGRPSFNPLIAHVHELAQARREGQFSQNALSLAQAFWPGPLTLVVPRSASSTVADIATAGLDSIALRLPAHPLARDILAATGRPVAAPSANRSGHVSPTSAAHVAADLDGRIEAILDGGSTRIGVESTILACLEGKVHLLRPGGIPREAVEEVLGQALATGPAEADDRPLSPGLMLSHYAPRAQLRLDARDVAAGEAWLGFGKLEPTGLGTGAARRNLSPSGDLTEAAANLFGMLRELDRSGAATIAVAPVPGRGLGEAIRDRLRRAAAGR